MKRYLLPVLVLTLALACLLGLASCGDKPSPSPEPGGTCEHAWNEGTVTAEATCKADGVKTFTCTLCGETKTETIPAAAHDFVEKTRTDATCSAEGTIISECRFCKEIKRTPIPKNDAHLWDEGTFTVFPSETSDGTKVFTCTRCGAARTETVKYDALSARVDELKAQIAAFTLDTFGGAVTENLSAKAGKTYPATPVSPTKGQHPRLLFTSADIPGILSAMQGKENLQAAEQFRKLADTDTDGKLGAPTDHSGNFYNWDANVLGIIQAKAFDYAVNANTVHGYEAILAMKNYLKTLDIEYIASDGCRQFGYTMYITALVYDWCYDLLTADDKVQLTSGVEHLLCTGSTPGYGGNAGSAKMEVGFPPKGQGAVTGHGSERQILRDYLAIAIAVADEYPDWWNFIGGRVYADYVPVREVYYEAGMYPQGSALYANGRYMSDLWSAWLVKGMSGTALYTADNMKQVMHSICSYMTNGKLYFTTGDSGSVGATLSSGYITDALISSYLFADAPMRAQAYYMKGGFSGFSAGVASLTNVEFLICSSDGLTCAEDRFGGDGLILYNGGYLNQIIAHNGRGADAASVYMKIGTRTTANHDHEDAGTFQIFYKSILAGDTGVYDSYGSTHHKYYHRGTVAHNGLLIYNPASASSLDGWYSGGQRSNSEASTLDAWSDSKYDTATLTGVSYGYLDDGRTKPAYAYIAGDIAQAYPSGTASEVTRRMLTVYNEDPTFPMFFIVYDNITAAGEDFRKAFLLHTVTEPVIEGKTVTTVSGDGKLVLQNLLGGDEILKAGQYDTVIGKALNPSKGNDGYWGRVEIVPAAGSKNSKLLNVMYVTDKGTAETVPAALIEGTGLIGARISDVAALFVPEAARATLALSATVTGEGNVRYYVSGVYAGTWNVSVGGQSYGTVTATEDGGFLTFTAPAGELTLTFTAPAGELTLTPGADIIPTYPIVYETNGGVMQNAPLTYKEGTALELPAPLHDNYTFEGWYTAASFDPETLVTEIPATATGAFTVYAKWSKTIVNVTFADAEIKSDGVSVTGEKGWTLNKGDAGNDPTLLFALIGEKGSAGRYLELRGGKGSPSVRQKGDLLLAMEDEHAFTVAVRMALAQDAGGVLTKLRLRGKGTTKPDGTTAVKSNANVAYVFGTDTDGKILIGSSTVTEEKLTTEFKTYFFTVDFDEGKIKAYTEDGTLFAESNLSLPSVIVTNPTDKPALDWFLENLGGSEAYYYEWTLGGDTGSALLVDSIRMIGGTDAVPQKSVTASDIVFETNGGSLTDAPATYEEGKALTLPVPTRDGFGFEGWYTAATFDPETLVTEIPASATGTFTVYAKWSETTAPIVFVLNGGSLTDAPATYEKGKAFTLPVPTRGDYDFKGWFTTASFDHETLVTEIPATADGTFTVYAKWSKTLIDVTFANAEFKSDGMSVTGETGWSGNKGDTGNDPTAIFALVGEKGTDGRYLELHGGKGSPSVRNKGDLVTAMDGAHTFTFTVRMALARDTGALNSNFRLRGKGTTKPDGTTAVKSNANVSYIFGTDTDGKILIGKSAVTEEQLTTDFKTYSFVVDFDEGKIKAYTENGTLFAESAISLPSVIVTNPTDKPALDWFLENLTGSEAYYYEWTVGGTTTSVLRIDSMKITTGSAF